MTERKYPPGDFISGFGGSYEDACQKMVLAGCDWFDSHPLAKPKFHGFEHVFGIIVEDNPIAKELTDVMVKACGGDATGAMVQACVGHVLWIRSHSWDEYIAEITKREEKK